MLRSSLTSSRKNKLCFCPWAAMNTGISKETCIKEPAPLHDNTTSMLTLADGITANITIIAAGCGTMPFHNYD